MRPERTTGSNGPACLPAGVCATNGSCCPQQPLLAHSDSGLGHSHGAPLRPPGDRRQVVGVYMMEAGIAFHRRASLGGLSYLSCMYCLLHTPSQARGAALACQQPIEARLRGPLAPVGPS